MEKSRTENIEAMAPPLTTEARIPQHNGYSLVYYRGALCDPINEGGDAGSPSFPAPLQKQTYFAHFHSLEKDSKAAV